MLREGYTVLWVLYAAVWVVAALGSKRTIRRQSATSTILHSLLVTVGFLLIFQPWRLGWLNVRFLPDTRTTAICGLAITAAGIGFAFWARFTLGGNWSSTVTIKEDHRLIQRGPYRIVRHPIYSGILLAAVGTAIGYGMAPCLIGVAIAFFHFWTKWRIEERFMVEQFGAQYIQYRQEVKALVPGML
ncbi:MAG: methyltransferase [Bryobacteraceae bacterium]|jgi:protein-S-isoprenylcysteine O-methyltransferase